MIEHFVQFYEDDAFLVTQVAGFIRTGLHAGDAAIVIATKPHRDDLEKRLRADVARAAIQRPGVEHYVALDAADTLSKFLVDGRPDAARFTELIGPILRRATGSSNGRVRVFGEMVALLSANGKHESAIRLEAFWNTLSRIHPMSIFFAPIRCTLFPGKRTARRFSRFAMSTAGGADGKLRTTGECARAFPHHRDVAEKGVRPRNRGRASQPY